MKIIDLLNKIAKGEEAPEKIKYKDDIFTYYEYADEIRKYYIYEKHNIYWFDREYFDLDTEVEIIEDIEERMKKYKCTYNKETKEYEFELKEKEEEKEIKTISEERDMYPYTFWESEYQTCNDLEKKIIDNICLLMLKQDDLVKTVNELKKGK